MSFAKGGRIKIVLFGLGLLAFSSAPALAVFPYVLGSGWQNVNMDILTPSPDGNGFGGTVDGPNTPWEVTLSSPGFLRVTDLGDAGDYYRIWDSMTEIGVTPQVPLVQSDPNNPPDEFDPNYTFGSSAFSHAVYTLGTGLHSFNFQDVLYASGNYDNLPEWFEGASTLSFRVDPVPEPGTIALLGLGLVASGLGLARRRRA
jgi:hypothetical protein